MLRVQFIVALAVYAFLFSYESACAEPNSEPITVSKETTFVVEPLLDNGLPDYEAYLLACGREGVTYENNAAVLLWNVFWPSGLSAEQRKPLLDALQMTTPPSRSKSLVLVDSLEARDAINAWLETDRVGNQWRLENAAEVIQRAAARPWRQSDVPPLADWVESNRMALDAFAEASKKSKLWSPPINFLNDRRDPLLSAELPLVANLRDSRDSLFIRPMMLIGETRCNEAWRDVFAIYRVANLLAEQSWTAVELVIAYNMEIDAHRLTVELIQNEQMSAAKLRSVLKQFQSLPAVQNIAQRLDSGERLAFLGNALSVLKPTREGLKAMSETDVKFFVKNDYNPNAVLKMINDHYDELVAIAEMDDRSKRKAAATAIAKQVEDRAAKLGAPESLNLLRASRAARTESVYLYLVCMLEPALNALLVGESDTVVRRDLTCAAVAVAIYRAEHGGYPSSLKQLVPDILSESPTDIYSGKPLRYELKDDGGCLLYSVYENGVDDGAGELTSVVVGNRPQGSIDEMSQADLVIRLRPKGSAPRP